MEDTRLKQRLIGAVVLVSLAVIFIPMILSGGDPAAKRSPDTAIPDAPEHEFVSRIIPLDKQAPEPGPIVAPKAEEKPDKKATAKAPVKKEVVAEVKPKPVEKPAKKQATVAKVSPPKVSKTVPAWVVQVGSFGSKDNAYSLRDKLRGKGFTSFVDSIHKDGKTKYRVRVGPEVKKENADKLLTSVEKITKTKGFVTSYP